VTPQLRTLDAIDFEDLRFERLARAGVTTVYVGGGPAAVLGSQGVVLKTQGDSADARVLREAAGATLTIGNEPFQRGTFNRRPEGGRSDIYTRRPTTRMGIVWVFREAMYAALPHARPGAAESDDPVTRELVRILRGEVPLRIQVRGSHDIRSAFRLTQEFGIEKVILEEAIEAARAIDRIREAGVPVIYGPIETSPSGWRGREVEEPNLSTPRRLHEAGVPLALSAGDADVDQALPFQAMCAVRYGLPFDAAMRAVTSTPASLLGVEKRVGTLAAGKDADIVIWSGKPFEATSRPVVVVIDGKVVHSETP
jgi:imidazolonepropionase-like amidohydrolase